MYNPDVIATLQKAVKSGEYADYQIYATHVNTRPVATIRDLFKLKDATPIPLDEVESVETILKRFDSAGMRSEEHTSELQSLMRTSYAVFCLKKKKTRLT